jgi:hypothetical protein
MRGISLALLLASLFPATGVGAPEEVPAGKMFRGELLDIRAPNYDGWSLIATSTDNWSFAYYSVGTNSTYIASVLSFSLPEAQSTEEFLTFIRQGIAKDTSPDRFAVIGAALEYSEARGYPCATYHATTQDRKAKTSWSKRKPQTLEIYSLYCRHPNLATLGFAIAFSHRGSELDPFLEQQAQDFIEGVQVPAAVAPLSGENEDDT